MWGVRPSPTCKCKAMVRGKSTKGREELIAKLQALPHRPGVYRMKDGEGRVIYVGKAKDLHNRVRSYFVGSGDGRPQFEALVRQIRDFDYIITDSEREALVLEAHLIKELKPKYNITLKDDKKYPYLKLTREPFPRLLVTRRLEKDGARYFGPYTDVKAMKRTLELVRRLFPLRNCNHRLPERPPERPCLNYQIKRCLGPCRGDVDPEDYDKVVRQVELFLKGRGSQVERILEDWMWEAARNLDYERAAELRDRLEDLRRTLSRQKVASPTPADWDAVGVFRDDEEACGVVLEVREGKVLDRKHYFIGGVMGKPPEEVMSAFLRQFYLDALEVPPEVHLPCPPEDEEELTEWLSEKRGGRVVLKVPQRGDKVRLVEMAAKNAEWLLVERRFKRERLREEAPYSVRALQRDLHLERPPRRIEAVDISTTQGSDAVGSLVCFVDGRPRKSEYRRYRIKTVEGQDDFAMMKEVVSRRFRRLLEEGRELPDLLLVDGGKGQLSSALEALRELGIEDQPVVGLAKRLEEVYLPGIPDPQNIPKGSASLRLLQQIRDEAHRFAVEFHRKLRAKRTLTSELDGIPGLGKVKKEALLKRFGSVRSIREASPEELQEVPGIGPKLARKVLEHLRGEDAS